MTCVLITMVDSLNINRKKEGMGMLQYKLIIFHKNNSHEKDHAESYTKIHHPSQNIIK